MTVRSLQFPLSIFAPAGRCAAPSMAPSRARALARRVRGVAAARRGRMLPGIDAVTRRWLHRSASPYVGEIAAIAATLGYSGIWFLNGCYQWGCTALAREQAGAPWLARTLDWPFPGLGRYLEIARMQGPAGMFDNVGWPGYVGALTASAPGRFAAAINQAPLRRRTRHPVAAPLRHGAQCGADLAHPLHPAGPSAAQCVRDLRELRRGQASAGNDADRPAGDLFAGRLRSRRAVRDRAHRGRLRDQGRQHLGRERLVAKRAILGSAHARRPDVHAHLRRDRGQQPCAPRAFRKLERDSSRTDSSIGSCRRFSIRIRGWRWRCVRPKVFCARSATKRFPVRAAASRDIDVRFAGKPPDPCAQR